MLALRALRDNDDPKRSTPPALPTSTCMATAASTKSQPTDVPSGSAAMHITPHSAPTSPTMGSFRKRTVSTSAYAKQDGNAAATDERQGSGHTPFPISSSNDHSQMNLTEASRARRTSATASGGHFSIPKTFSISSPLGFFSRRRKSMQHPQRPSEDLLGDVLEIGPPDSERLSDVNAINEDEERHRLRDAAAQALGLGLGRDSSGTPEPELEDTELAEITPVADKSTNPYVLDPIPRIPLLNNIPIPYPPSLISLSNSHSHMASSIMNTIPGTADALPPYPSTLSSLKPFIQTSSSLLKYHPASTFLTLTLTRRTKQWKLHYAVFTSPPPAAFTYDSLSTRNPDPTQLPSADARHLRQDAVLQVSNNHNHNHNHNHNELSPLPGSRSSHLHLFKSATPAPEEMEVDRLEINEDSIVYVAELDIGGKRDVVKVGGRDARSSIVGSGRVSLRSTGSSWHGGMKTISEPKTEEMGRTMWLLNMTDGSEMRRWMGHIKTAIYTQRAERAGITLRQHGPSAVPSMRADLDVLLSSRSEARLPNVAVSSEPTSPYPGYTTPSVDTISHVISIYPSQTSSSQVSPHQQPPSSFSHTSLTNPATRPTSPNPNPRYSEHVGAAPSHTSPASLRARTYPTPSVSNHGLSLKSLLVPGSTPNRSGFSQVNGSAPGKRPSSRQTSRPSSPLYDSDKDIDPISDDSSLGNRAAALLNVFRSNSRMSNNHNQRTSVSNYLTTVPASTARSPGLGTPISPDLYSDETVRGNFSPGANSATFSDWSMINDSGSTGNKQTSPGTSSLPPPPRHPRRPIGNSFIRGNVPEPTNRDVKRVNGTGHIDDEGSSVERRSTSPPYTASSSAISPASAPSIPGSSSTFRGGRPPSANSMSSRASQDLEVDRGNSLRSRTMPRIPASAPPNGPSPTPPSIRAHSTSGPPSPILEQDITQRNGSSIGGRFPEPSGSATSTWGSQHPYSNRVSGSSAMSVTTTSTGHSFLGSKPLPPPPPRPPPNFSPPPAPTDAQQDNNTNGVVVPVSSINRESFISRSLRLSLVPPPGAPPTQSLPPRPDEPGYRHRRAHSTEVRSTSGTVLAPIPASPTPPSSASCIALVPHPSAAPPPSGPLPPTPDNDRDYFPPSSSLKESRHTSLTHHRLRILSTPSPVSQTHALAIPKDATGDSQHRHLAIGEPILSHPDSYPPMFLNMSDTPITPAVSHPMFLPVPSLQPEENDDVEPTPLSPPPRRNSRNSKEIRAFNHDKDLSISTTPSTPLSHQDSGVVIQHR